MTATSPERGTLEFVDDTSPNILSITLSIRGELRLKSDPTAIFSPWLLPGQERLLVERGWYWGSRGRSRAILHPAMRGSTVNAELSGLVGRRLRP